MQILEIAFSLLICYSLAYKANLKASFPLLSLEIPTNLPGNFLIYLNEVAKNAACGPPYPN